MLSLQQLLQVVALLLLLPQSTSLSAEACSAAQFQADNCPYYYQFNGECNADGKKCVIGSDCFDCDPCQQFRFQGCQSCTAAGCLWCSLDAVCVSTGSTVSNVSQLTCTTSDYVRRCVETPGSVFSDPFYDAMSWIYDQINVKEVWQSGISKSLLPSHKLSESAAMTNYKLCFPRQLCFTFSVCSRCWNRHSHQRYWR